MAPEVMISYLISEDEYQRTVGLRWNEDTFPLYYCFFGLVNFRIREQEVLDNGKFDMSVADLAVGLSELLEKLRNISSGRLQFQQSDDSLQITFEVEQKEVTISHNLAPGRTWKCTTQGLVSGIEQFGRSFANEVVHRVPRVFEWRDMKILEHFANPPAQTSS